MCQVWCLSGHQTPLLVCRLLGLRTVMCQLKACIDQPNDARQAQMAAAMNSWVEQVLGCTLEGLKAQGPCRHEGCVFESR